MYHEYFPEEIIELQQELKKHPQILAKLANKDLMESLAIIGAELGILLDGLYTPVELARLFLRKLKERGSLIVRSDPSLIPIEIKETTDSMVIREKKNQ